MRPVLAVEVEAPARLNVKACLVGEPFVGKTCLIRRYVLDAFEDRYVATLGTKVSRAEVAVTALGRPLSVNLIPWDLMGTRGFRELLKEAYFAGAAGLLAVADLTRESTLDPLREWIESAIRVAGSIPVVVAASKADLANQAEIEPVQVSDFAVRLGYGYVTTSAKTGEGVEDAFRQLATRIAESRIGGTGPDDETDEDDGEA